MALLYQAELRPSKMELLDGWAPSQPWFRGEPGVKLLGVAAFRFDDPEGEVGVETHLVRAGDGPIMQAPVTYRGAPLAGAEESLIGTMEHSVLGKRWVYDGAGDPVYLLTVASAALTGARQAELVVEVDGALVKQEPNAVVTGGVADGVTEVTLPAVDALTVRNEGVTTIVETGALRVVVVRVPDAATVVSSDAPGGALSGTWDSQPEPLVLVTVGA